MAKTEYLTYLSDVLAPKPKVSLPTPVVVLGTVIEKSEPKPTSIDVDGDNPRPTKQARVFKKKTIKQVAVNKAKRKAKAEKQASLCDALLSRLGA